MPGTTASTTLGPGVARARASSSVNSSAVVARAAGRPRPRARLDEVQVGPAEVEHVPGPGPGSLGPHPVELHVQHGVGVVVQDDGGDVEALPGHGPPATGGCRARSRRPRGRRPAGRGRPPRRPRPPGSPWPMAPPVRQSQSWGGEPAVAPGANSPAVFPSSETMAPSGSRAPRAWHTAWAVRAPGGQVRRPGVLARARPRDGPGQVGQRGHRGGHVVGRPGHRDGPCSLRAPGRWACPGRRRTRPGDAASSRTRWRTPSRRSRRTRPGRPAARPAGGRRPVRAGPGTSRTAARRRWRRPGRPRRRGAGRSTPVRR